MELVLKNNNILFKTKAVKLDKKTKQKNKTKSKYSLDISYLNKDKRSNFLVKQLYLHSNNYNYYSYEDRLLMSFFNCFFLEKNSEIYKNKVFIYKSVLKKNSK